MSSAATSSAPDGSCTARPRPSSIKAQGVFAGLPNPFEATRYHSLLVEARDLPVQRLEITAETAEGEIMGLRHRELPIHGVQFHPESILTLEGKRLLKNFLAL